ncbi:MAG: HAMP domain-containing histidine kinase [Reichenbachiella sp.]
MKLIHKFILVYLLLSLVVFSIGGIITFYTFSKVNDKETDKELRGQAHQIYKLIKKEIPLAPLNDNYDTKIKILKDTIDLKKSSTYSDTLAFHRSSNDVIPFRKITHIRNINGIWYQIEIHNSLLEPDDTIYGVFVSNSLVYLLLVSCSLLLSFFISKWLLSPFNLSLQTIEKFSLKDQSKISFPKTNIAEFDQLNQFIQKMTEKAILDYNNLREFSENIAHEIRTPLAVASGKLDLLLQVQNIEQKDAQMIAEAQQSLKKISNIQHSLAIMSKIQNEEFHLDKKTDVSKIVHAVLEQHEDLTSLRKIKVTTHVISNLVLKNDPVWLEMIVTNLIQNAIKHNLVENGFIEVSLTKEYLMIKNSGEKLKSSSKELIHRFKKNGNGTDSLGLGLSIVKDICQKSGYQLNYDFDGFSNEHQLSVTFQNSDSLQN